MSTTYLDVAQDCRESSQLEIVHDESQGVVLVNDGQYRWAGELAAWVAACERPWPYAAGYFTDDEDDVRSDEAAAYSYLCASTPQLPPSDPRVVAACEGAGWDVEWIMEA